MRIYGSLIIAVALVFALLPIESFASAKEQTVKTVPISRSGSSAKITHKFRKN